MKQKISWENHLVGLAVVFIGVTVAFGLNNWRQSRTDRQLEAKYIASLQTDTKQIRESQ